MGKKPRIAPHAPNLKTDEQRKQGKIMEPT